MEKIDRVLREEVSFLKEAFFIPIHEGYSQDKKFLVTHADQKYFLRLFAPQEYELKKKEFAILCKMEAYQVKCPRPLALGLLKEADLGYMLLSYLEGENGKKALQGLSDSEQFGIGLEAGRELRKMNQYKAPETMDPWYDRKVKKHQRYMEEYLALGVRFPHDDKVSAFIEEHLHHMKDRPNLFQHDDFHLGNIVVKEKRMSGVVDFERFDWGDPIHEFLKVGMFSRQESVPFSVGQILGYHDHQEPSDSFWLLYALYIAMCLFSSVVWILKVYPKELDHMLQLIDQVLEDHDLFTTLKPQWYKEHQA